MSGAYAGWLQRHRAGGNHGCAAGEESDGGTRLQSFPAGVSHKTRLFIALIVTAGGLAFTPVFALDAMARSSSTAMTHGDAMHTDAMKGTMSHDSMKKDGMKMGARHPGAMRHDAMEHDAMKG